MYVFTLHSIMYVGEANFHQSSEILLELLKTQIVSQSINPPPPDPPSSLQDHVTTLPCDKYQKMEEKTRLVIMCNPILSCQCHCAHVTCVGCQWGHDMSAFIQQKQSRSQSSLKKKKKKEKSFSLIANVTLAVTQWHSRPPRLFFALCHFLPGIRGLVISLPITLARPRPNLARDVPLHPPIPTAPSSATLPTPPAWFFMPLVVPQSADAGKCWKHNSHFLRQRRNLCFSVTPREEPMAYLWRMTL